MTPAMAPSHPDIELLRQFDRGEVCGPEADTVEAHLETCVECCQTLRGLPADPLLVSLRAAAAEQPAAPSAECEVPAELRDHPRYRVLDLLGKGGMGPV